MSRWLYAGLVVVTTGLMGSSFALGKLGLAYVSPLLLVGLRFTAAGALLAVAVWRRPRPAGWRPWLGIATIGLFQTAGVMGAIFLSLRTISAGESSILTFSNPLLVVIFATLWTGARYRGAQWLGVGLGLVGVVVSLGAQLNLHVGTVLALAGAVCWAVATLLVKAWGGGLDVWVLSAYQMLAGGVLLLAAGLTLEPPRFAVTALSLGILAWLAVMASIVQFGIWFWLLQHGDAGRTSAFLFLVPLFGVLFGFVILGEPIGWPVVFGGPLIVAGIALVNWPATVRAPADPRRQGG